MVGRISRFEAGIQARSPLFWITVLVFGFLTFGAVVSDDVSIGESIGNIHRNAPYVIIQMLAVMSLVGVFAVTAFVGTAAGRDFECRTWELVFSKPVRKRDYLIGHFAGAFSASVAVLLAATVAMILASFMPWLDPSKLGPFRVVPYLWALGVIAIPNLFVTGALFYTLAGVTRSMLWTYLGVVVLFVSYSIAGHLVDQLGREHLAALLDPFALSALGEATRYWTVAEKNTLVPALGGTLLANRLIWMAVGIAVLAVGGMVFGRSGARAPARRRAAVGGEAAPDVPRGPSMRGNWCGGSDRGGCTRSRTPFRFRTRCLSRRRPRCSCWWRSSFLAPRLSRPSATSC